MTTRIVPLFLTVALLTAAALAQNRFEGSNVILDVPETQKSTVCALRFAPPSTPIAVTDLDPSTPMSLKSCDGSGAKVAKTGPGAYVLTASPTDGKWCFQGEDKAYRIAFAGDGFAGGLVYNWIANPPAAVAGRYNVRDFGAVGDGRTDDADAFRGALAYVANRGGGVLTVPEGDYLVGTGDSFKPLAMPSNVVVEGVGGLQSNAPTSDAPRRNPARIRLGAPGRALFRIGECTEKIQFRNIELYSEAAGKTVGVEALGAYNSSQDMHFENVAVTGFDRGIYAHGLPQTNLGWQFDYVTVVRCRFTGNRDAAIYTNVRNTDWRIQDSFFINPKHGPTQNADSMVFEHASGILVDNTYGGGFPGALGGTFLKVHDSWNILVSHSQTEAMTNSFVYNEDNNPNAGDYSGPLTFVNVTFANPIIFRARRTFVSTGSYYGGDAFQADERVRVYSTGDRFCYDGYILDCRGAEKKNFDRATVVFMTGQPDEKSVKGHPTFFGTDVRFGAPIQLPSMEFGKLPTGKPNGSTVYCADCKRGGTPCQSGGTGAPAMVVNGIWSCL